MLNQEIGRRMLRNALQAIQWISDKEYQRKVWIGGAAPNDFDETACVFFENGDPVLSDYEKCGLTKAQYLILKQFTDVFRSFSDNHSYEPEFIDTPEWDEITKMAADVLKAFDYKSAEDRKNLLKVFLQIVCGISNTERKQQEWVLAEGPEPYDYGEICYRLVDEADLILKNYKDFGITDSQYQIMKKFRDRYYIFCRPYSWPPEFTDIPEWTEIRELAQEVLKAFDYKP